jgi:hypothetical protein
MPYLIVKEGSENGSSQKARQEQRPKESPKSDNKAATASNERLGQIKTTRENAIDCGGAS